MLLLELPFVARPDSMCPDEANGAEDLELELKTVVSTGIASCGRSASARSIIARLLKPASRVFE